MRHSALSLAAQGNVYLEPGDWVGTLSYRWLHSDRHFRGREEEPHRQAQGTEVINDIHSFELTVSYAVNKRLTLNLTMPFVHAERSSLYEHDGVHRHTMKAGGLGDMRLVGNFWLLNADQHAEGNVALGIGLKAPSGDYRATDLAHRPEGRVLRPVDQSIQPGDGGWGLILELTAFQKLFNRTYCYASGSYLVNPREKNGTETTTSRPGRTVIMSVPDQYLGRVGLSYLLWPGQNLSLTLGGRIEGVPVRDLIGGGDDGFRRPGYAVSIEPGLVWSRGKSLFSLSAPVALERNRERSIRDLRAGTHGDAAFADFLILASFSRRF